MIVINDLVSLPDITCKTVITLGNFEGLHLGHREIISNCVSMANEINGKSIVVSYDHQNSPLYNSEREYLYLNNEKIHILEQLKVDYLLLIPFTSEIRNITARDFLFNLIKKKLNASLIIIGYDHHFGKNREGNIDYLIKYQNELNFEVKQVNPVLFNEEVISSSRIRNEISQGNIKSANEMLGVPYHITGMVEKGYGRGKVTGFPTANIRTAYRKLIPSEGVYIGKAEVNNQTFKAVINIGKNPTFNNNKLTIECHLLDFKGDLYGHNLTAYFLEKIRDEKKFKSVEELHWQIEADIKSAEKYYSL